MLGIWAVELHMIGAPLYFQPPDWTDRSTIRLSECRVNEALAKVNTGNAAAEDYKNTLKARLMRRSSWS
ncbi:hypothetical protein AMTR_s02223p00009410 [Amborella trichopoda]|uniref:Uncharacterized protein n=1 Tax=Amborella trichopoda TaxID=13333 RepID=U5CYE4_AMBTC|nr:hypothetical protein AMTR_s02223p00009410 [Amborella trichopoda]